MMLKSGNRPLNKGSGAGSGTNIIILVGRGQDDLWGRRQDWILEE